MLHLSLSHNKPKDGTNIRHLPKFTQLTMINQDQRNLLLREIQPGDYFTAAEEYKQLTGREIYPRYLQKFLKGERKVTGRKVTGHDPLKMYEALAEAIRKRKESDAKRTAAAAQIYKQKLILKMQGDLKPSPIAQ